MKWNLNWILENVSQFRTRYRSQGRHLPVHGQCSNVVHLVSIALRDEAPREFPLYSSAQNESPGTRWKAFFLNMAPALSICQWLGCISSGSINQKPTFGELCPGPRLKVPAAVCASCNPGKGQVEQGGLTWQGGKMVLIQILGDDFLWGRSNPVSQRGAEEVVEHPTDFWVSNSICSRSAGGVSVHAKEWPSIMFCGHWGYVRPID